MSERREPVLVVIGGGEGYGRDPVILREFVRCAGGETARIAVVTVASSRPKETGARYVDVFKQLGVRDAYSIDVREREDADTGDVVDAIEQATATFFTGGDQERVVSVLGGTPVDDVLQRRYKEGMVLGGTSAGAAIMADMMVIGGQLETNPRLGNVEITAGMGFIPEVMIDQHFAERGRFGRLLVALAENPRSLGLGIDENTAAIVRNDTLEVIGDGAVTILDMHSLSHTNVPNIDIGESIALFDVKLHILPHGYRFNLADRTPVTPTDARGSPERG